MPKKKRQWFAHNSRQIKDSILSYDTDELPDLDPQLCANAKVTCSTSIPLKRFASTRVNTVPKPLVRSLTVQKKVAIPKGILNLDPVAELNDLKKLLNYNSPCVDFSDELNECLSDDNAVSSSLKYCKPEKPKYPPNFVGFCNNASSSKESSFVPHSACSSSQCSYGNSGFTVNSKDWFRQPNHTKTAKSIGKPVLEVLVISSDSEDDERCVEQHSIDQNTSDSGSNLSILSYGKTPRSLDNPRSLSKDSHVDDFALPFHSSDEMSQCNDICREEPHSVGQNTDDTDSDLVILSNDKMPRSQDNPCSQSKDSHDDDVTMQFQPSDEMFQCSDISRVKPHSVDKNTDAIDCDLSIFSSNKMPISQNNPCSKSKDSHVDNVAMSFHPSDDISVNISKVQSEKCHADASLAVSLSEEIPEVSCVNVSVIGCSDISKVQGNHRSLDEYRSNSVPVRIKMKGDRHDVEIQQKCTVNEPESEKRQPNDDNLLNDNQLHCDDSLECETHDSLIPTSFELESVSSTQIKETSDHLKSTDIFSASLFITVPDLSSLETKTFSAVKQSLIEACKEDGHFTSESLELIHDLTNSKCKPSGPQLTFLYDCLSKSDRMDIVNKAYVTLSHVARMHPGEASTPWDMVEKMFSNLFLHKLTRLNLMGLSLLLDHVTTVLQVEVVINKESRRKSQAWKLLSPESNFRHVSRLLEWLFRLLHEDDETSLCISESTELLSLNSSESQREPLLRSCEIRPLLPLLARLLEVAVVASLEPLPVASRIAMEIVDRFFSNGMTFCRRKRLLSLPTSPLLKFKVTEHFLCPATTSCQSLPSFQSLVDAMSSCYDLITQADDYLLLVSTCVTSYIQTVQGQCHVPMNKRKLPSCKPCLSDMDNEALINLCHFLEDNFESSQLETCLLLLKCLTEATHTGGITEECLATKAVETTEERQAGTSRQPFA